ncbi:spermidine N1-acetyltransferase [uncultured Cardiobacterium sp.]|uniref:spermidine N1-acetyltransferase n=1 Tax=uncultured Cardiobacterium sp. TaxID=417619 RepID=UPI0034357E55
MTAPSPASAIRLRPLERGDLYFVHRLDNNANVMRYWFAEPYETFDELTHLYDEHIRDQRERRFVIEYGPDEGGKRNNIAGLVELVEIDHIHRRAEYQIIVAPDHQGKGIATRATELALEYGFSVLNLYKIYLIVDVENAGARHVYEKIGFQAEGTLRHEFFINGQYRDVTRMCLFQHEYLQRALTANP